MDIKGKIPPGFFQEYSKARNIGAVLNIIIPLLSVLSLVLFLNPNDERLAVSADVPVFAFTLLTFSIAICIMARAVLQRLVSHVRRVHALKGNWKNKLLLAYTTLYLLFLCPGVWGIIFYVLTWSILGLIGFNCITIAAFLFFTPSLEEHFKD